MQVDKNLSDIWLHALVSSLPDATMITDQHRNILILNQLFCDLFGIKQAPEELAGYNSSDLLAEHGGILSDLANVASRLLNLYETRQQADGDILRLRDGRIIVRSHRPIHIKDHFIGHLWSYQDETEKIRITDQLKEQKAFYEDILNNIPADIAIFSPTHHYLYMNPIAISDADLRKWLIGKTDADYCIMRGKDMAIAEKRRAIFKKITADKCEHSWEERLINKKGEESYHLRRMSPVYDEAGALKLIIGYGMDITGRKKIEEQILLSERRYRDLFNYSQAMICTHDMEGRLLEVNPAFCETLELTETQLTGSLLQSLIPDSDKSMFEDIYLPSIINNKKAKGLFRMLTASGRRLYLLYQNYYVNHPDQPPYVVAFAQDVTDRIKAEKELKAAKKTTDENARAKEKFLANMSHEIRTPMSGILGITALLQKTLLNNEQQGYVNLLNDSAQNLLNIINDILDLGKITAGEIVLEKIEFDIITKISSTLKLFQVNAADKKLALYFDNQIGNRYTVTGDPTRFTQILNNLLSNAIKFTHSGSIELYAGIEEETDDEAVLHFYVKDSGIGIDENKLIQIFQPFTQAYAETTRKYGGTGLGLAITQNLIELQQGQIWVESKPRKGSTFHFTITYAKPGNTMAQSLNTSVSRPSRVSNQLGQLKVLLAEDNDINQLLAKSILQYWGFETKVATNGNEAVQLVRKEQFDIILMDIQMPEKSGIEAAMEIRAMADKQKQQIPIIALTANALKGEEMKYFAAGMNDYLTKPFNEHELYTVITRVYQSKRNPL
ncbi:PAS domain S-box protein [Deminuibacter soli]|uniref:histidine kinase n=1 Tax=Deminuibacter soli TaxID=2291815 RepID=A0A3E1NNE4_9BACT|nr:PAS domain S-box protein [Deminuibacter soli]RFM29440.1 PAS domain S-box protein [Deminuibacter soli]